MKEQQKMLEAQLVSLATQQQIPNIQTPDILNALKAMQDSGTKEAKQGDVFTAPTGIPDHTRK